MTRKKHRGGHNYKFTEKTHSGRGIFAMILAILSITGFGVMAWFSFLERGNAGIYIGSAGVFGFLMSVAALATAVGSVREPETFRVIPYTSLVLSIVSVGIWIAVYVGGIL